MADETKQQAPTDTQSQTGTGTGTDTKVSPETIRQLQSMLRPRTELSPMKPSVPADSMGKQIGMGLLGAFVPFVGGAIQQHMRAQKAHQVNEAVNEFSIINGILEDASARAAIDSKGDAAKEKELTSQYASQDPRMAAMFEGPAGKKRLKNFAKVFSVDWMNPEKSMSTVHGQGLKKFLQLEGASKNVEQMGAAIKQHAAAKPELQKLIESLPTHQVAPTPQAVESFARIQQQASEFDQRQQELIAQHQRDVEFKRDTLQARIDDQKARMEQRQSEFQQMMELRKDSAEAMKQYRTDMMDLRRQMAKDMKDYHDEMIELRTNQLAMMKDAKGEKSKIPTILISRLSQAQIIKEQLSDLREQMKDPDVAKFMGPVRGLSAPVIRRLSGKVQKFFASQESMDALLAILHAYRGGAHIHGVFRDSMGTLTMDPEAYKGTLDAIDKLSDNVTDELRKEYPNDPIWKGIDAARPMDEKKAIPPPPGGAVVDKK